MDSECAEVDISHVTRPELIIQPDLTAICVPVMERQDEGIAGCWHMHLQSSCGRKLFPLLDASIPINGRELFFSPMPATPSVQDVQDLCKWSKQSRDAWMDKAEAPTTFDLFCRIARRIDRYVYFPEEYRQGHIATLSVWVLMTYLFRAFPAVPYLYFSGPLGSGKTRAMEALAQLSWRPLTASSLTGPTLFRGRHATGGAFFLDEAERMQEDSPEIADLRSMLLAGYKRGGTAKRLEPVGDTYRMVSFDVYGPTVLACIKGLPAALSSRCITLRMMRAPKGEPRTKTSIDDNPEEQQDIVDGLHCWALEHGYAAATCDIDSHGLANRDAELWMPLLRIASHTGDDGLVELLAKHASEMVAASAGDKAPDADPVFLSALYRLRRRGELPTPNDVLDEAREIEQGCFESFRPRGLSNVLKNYDITTDRSNGKRVYRTEIANIIKAAENYGYELGGSNE